jgi:hypothetical protein
MPKRSTCGALVAFALAVLGACGAPAPASAPAARLELAAAWPSATECGAALPGELRVERVDGALHLAVSGATLCAGERARHELPPGLYTLSWRGAGHDPTHPPSPLRAPGIFSLFAGQTTRLRVVVEPAQPAARAGATARTERPEPACRS